MVEIHRKSAGARPDLPPLFELVTLRESGDAFAHACAIAPKAGAGTLVVTGRFDTIELALILEPDEPLSTARRAFFLCMDALCNALALHVPPEKPLTIRWPDAILLDGVVTGGGRLAWPEGTAEDAVPDWLVFGGEIAADLTADPDRVPMAMSLIEAVSAAGMARKSSAYATGAPWKLPFEETEPSSRTMGLSTLAASSRSATRIACAIVSRRPPVT